jgi:putative hydrolase of the HAD superfamily
VTISCEVGAEKPDTRIFHAALAAAGVVSAEACHIGDSIREDIRGAEATGMRALLINRRAGESLGGLMEKLT